MPFPTQLDPELVAWRLRQEARKTPEDRAEDDLRRANISQDHARLTALWAAEDQRKARDAQHATDEAHIRAMLGCVVAPDYLAGDYEKIGPRIAHEWGE